MAISDKKKCQPPDQLVCRLDDVDCTPQQRAHFRQDIEHLQNHILAPADATSAAGRI